MASIVAQRRKHGKPPKASSAGSEENQMATMFADQIDRSRRLSGVSGGVARYLAERGLDIALTDEPRLAQC